MFSIINCCVWFWGQTSKHKNLEPSENQNCKFFFYFHFTFCFQFVFCVFFISYISFFFDFNFSGNRGVFSWSLPIVLPSPTQILMCSSHFFQDFVCSSNQFYCSPNSLLEFQFSFDLEFDLCWKPFFLEAQWMEKPNDEGHKELTV